MAFSFDSVVFTTGNLSVIRDFYELKLGFPTGSYSKDGKLVPDYSESYVNYHIAGGLVGFEQELSKDGVLKEPTTGDLVLRVTDFEEFKNKVKAAGIPRTQETKMFFIVEDPEGRTLIFEPSR